MFLFFHEKYFYNYSHSYTLVMKVEGVSTALWSVFTWFGYMEPTFSEAA